MKFISQNNNINCSKPKFKLNLTQNHLQNGSKPDFKSARITNLKLVNITNYIDHKSNQNLDKNHDLNTHRNKVLPSNLNSEGIAGRSQKSANWVFLKDTLINDIHTLNEEFSVCKNKNSYNDSKVEAFDPNDFVDADKSSSDDSISRSIKKPPKHSKIVAVISNDTLYKYSNESWDNKCEEKLKHISKLDMTKNTTHQYESHDTDNVIKISRIQPFCEEFDHTCDIHFNRDMNSDLVSNKDPKFKQAYTNEFLRRNEENFISKNLKLRNLDSSFKHRKLYKSSDRYKAKIVDDNIFDAPIYPSSQVFNKRQLTATRSHHENLSNAARSFRKFRSKLYQSGWYDMKKNQNLSNLLYSERSRASQALSIANKNSSYNSIKHGNSLKSDI